MTAEQRIRIRLKAFDHRILDRSAQEIVNVARSTGARVKGPVPLPTERHIYCVIRSPFIDKESMEHFELCIHKRLIDILDVSAETVNALRSLNLPSGVDIEVKL
ncbi:MAG: 30S ribosomal protein S10 [Armatimonadetes bacterium]|nr:30S ribosomal protein S10 [Armatimonadota bacterium]MDW8121158.1 30S ribosomal protein S10 [Armatimonadota bacterium]